MGAVLHPPGGGELHKMGPAEVIIKATSEDTAGSFFMSETTIAPGFAGPPPHTHEKLVDMFYVLEGALTMRLGDEESTVEPGSFVCVPPGTIHTFSNPSDSPVRFLNFNTPGGWENYMRDLAEASGGEPLSPREIGAIAARYDFKPA